jgi:hypothetical protein
MEGGEAFEPPRFWIEVNVARGRWGIAVLWLHHSNSLKCVVETTVALHCKTVCFNQVFGDVNIFSIVLSKRIPFLMFHYLNIF